MIGRRSLRPYKPSQLLTGHIDDFPLEPEAPTFVRPRPILSPAAPTAPIAEEPAALTAPVDDSPTPPPPGNEAVVECPEAAEDLAVTAPITGLPGRCQTGLPRPRQVALGRSSEPGRSVANDATSIVVLSETESSRRASPTTDVDRNDATSIVVLSETESSRRASPTIDVTIAPATIEVTSPPANSRPTNSRARQKSRSRRKKKAAPAPAPPQHASRRQRHKELCGICASDCREEIDDAFINWESVNDIASEFQIERRVVYRHAHATGLFPKRDRNIRRALGLIIHRADKVQGVTADSVIRAVHLLAHINEAGEWIAPPAHVIVSSGSRLSVQDSRPEQTRRATVRPANALPSRTDQPRLPEPSPDALPEANLLDTRCQAAKKLNP
jgi:hypothetical protein